MIIVVSVAFIFIFQENILTTDIKEKVLRAIDNVAFYSYSANGTIEEIMKWENETEKLLDDNSWYNHSTNYDSFFNVDIHNKQLKGELDNYTIYYSDETQYLGYTDYNYWSAISNEESWYLFSYLEAVKYIFEEGTIKNLDNEIINDSDYYKLEISSIFDNKELNRTFTSMLLPQRRYSSNSDVVFNEEYTCNIFYWIEKNTFLPKKIYIELRYFVNRTSHHNYLGNATWNITSYYKTTIFFEKYNEPLDMEAPWKSFQDNAEELLNNLEYYNLDFGFGFNPPANWTLFEPGYYEGLISGTSLVLKSPDVIFIPQNQSYFNIYFSIEPIDSIFESKNLSEKVENRISEIQEMMNRTVYMENYFLVSHGNTTINEMEAYEFLIVTGTNESRYIEKEIYIQKDERIFEIRICGYNDYYYDYIIEIGHSINSSLKIIVPYYYINYS